MIEAGSALAGHYRTVAPAEIGATFTDHVDVDRERNDHVERIRGGMEVRIQIETLAAVG